MTHFLVPRLLSIYLLIIGAWCSSQRIDEYQILRPSIKPDYDIIKQQCEWKLTVKSSFDTCPGDRMECFVPFSSPKGDGYWSIVRYGPYSSTGGYIESHCIGTGHNPQRGSWLVEGVLGAIDPFSEEYFEFPPIHIHHVVLQSSTFNPIIPPTVTRELTWLTFSQSSYSTFLFPSGSADSQCTYQHGGTGCFFHAYPSGYGKRAYRQTEDNRYVFHIQDVRVKDSPKLSYVLEFAEKYVTKPSATAPLKPVVDITLGVFGPKAPFTYPLEYNTPMYNFVTYYFPMGAQLVGNRMHWHPVRGDEAWVIRGTQSNLGLALQQQRPPVLSPFETPVGMPHRLPENVTTMKEFKLQLERHLLETAVKRFSSLNGLGKGVLKEQLHNFKNLSALRDAAHINRTIPIQMGVPYLVHKAGSLSPQAPEILCKYFGQQEFVSNELLSKKRREQASKASNAEQEGFNDPSAASAPFGSEVTGLTNRVYRPTVELVDFSHQQRAKYTGTQPGWYYRASTNSQFYESERYTQCHDFTVEPGEFITIVHFIEPRSKPIDPEEYDSTPLTLTQHTQFMTHIHVPNLPYL